jgi:hypothetical protein
MWIRILEFGDDRSHEENVVKYSEHRFALFVTGYGHTLNVTEGRRSAAGVGGAGITWMKKRAICWVDRAMTA